MEELTYKALKKALRKFRKAYVAKSNKGYLYKFPSPNKGKQLVIQGHIEPGKAATMAIAIWEKTAKVSDFPCMKEVDIKLLTNGTKIKYIETSGFHIIHD